MSERKGGQTSIKLKDLKLHPLIEMQSELLASLEYSLNSINDLSREAVKWILNLHPVFVNSDKQNVYRVVCGIRSFNIASRILDAEEKIRVIPVDGATKETITTAIYCDLFLTPLTFSLHNAPKSLADIFKILPDNTAKEFIPELVLNKSKLARGLRVSTNTLYYRKVKSGEKK